MSAHVLDDVVGCHTMRNNIQALVMLHICIDPEQEEHVHALFSLRSVLI